MTPDEQTRLVNALNGLAEILDTPLTAGRIAGYLLALDDLDVDDLVGAIGQSARNDKFFPKPCDLRSGAEATQRRRAWVIRDAMLQAEANARAGRLVSPEDAAKIAEQDAIESARVAQFKREFPGVLDAPPHERFGRWWDHLRRQIFLRSMPGART
jgi:hypothetical protein